MKRREFLSASLLTATAAALPHTAGAQSASLPIATYPVGDFILRRTRNGLQAAHKSQPNRVIWDTAPDGEFLIAETATADIQSFGTPAGSFEIKDTVSASYTKPTIDALVRSGASARVTGQLTGPTGKLGYQIVFQAVSPKHLRFPVTAVGAGAGSINRIRLILGSTADEALFGFGHQLTYFNQKGHVLPILVQEHGVGRGQLIITQAMDIFGNRGGGTPYTTECPAPHFISSRLRSMFLENLEYSVFDLRHSDRIDIKVWSPVMTGRILHGRAPLDLIEAYTEYAGRMRALPGWIHNGIVVSVQGGTGAVRDKLQALNNADIPIAGLWIQDWPGVRVTNVGKQLWWDWKLDESYYPGWSQLVADLDRQGARMLTYINPFLSIEEGHDSLFKHARANGYLVRNPDGTPFLNKNTNFSAALVDLSNPDARTWIKSVINEEMIRKAGSSGWMHDFGEAMPFTGKLHGGADPAVWHNRYPQEWARVAREAIEEAGRGDDIVFFNRSGFTQSPGLSTLFWLGDQIQNWSEYDGIKSAVVGLLSGGMSGFSLLHSDTGGYAAFGVKLGDETVPLVARTPELLMRWIELNAFTAVFRTHEGLNPPMSAQFDTSADTIAHMRRFGKIYRGLAAYRKGLVADAAAKGHPVVRALFLHYPDDPNTHNLRYQFMLGPDLMIAPVVEKGAERVETYFPRGSAWVDLWTGKDAGEPGKWRTVSARLGTPAVFLRKGASSVAAIINGLKDVGVL